MNEIFELIEFFGVQRSGECEEDELFSIRNITAPPPQSLNTSRTKAQQQQRFKVYQSHSPVQNNIGVPLLTVMRTA